MYYTHNSFMYYTSTVVLHENTNNNINITHIMF